MVKKDKRKSKRVNIKKARQKLIKEKKKLHPDQDLQMDKKSTKKIDIRLEKETKLYWIRAITAALSGLLGRLVFGFIGWPLLIWMLCFWFITPFVVSFVILKYDYDKEEWNWKNIIKPGIGIFFFLFMIVTTVTHTFLAFL
ncbi:MAG: hypothetical protein HWN79_01535 [Candidatus Lokiarchaeota archaeon]|nr:hypothetical protein [Candidatus Lokiarchaeota archaeon]